VKLGEGNVVVVVVVVVVMGMGMMAMELCPSDLGPPSSSSMDEGKD